MFCIQPMPAVDAMLAIAAPSTMSGMTASVSCRRPQKFTSITSRSENVFGRPAQLNSAFTTWPIRAAVAAICSGSRRSHGVKLARPEASGGLMSIAWTSAPSSTRICAVAAPIPDAAPVTITRLPSYRSTSFTGSVLDADRPLGTVLRSEARLLGERALDLGDDDLAVPEVVGREHVGGE